MAKPTNDLEGRLRGLDDRAFHAMNLPDVPVDRLAVLQEIRLWSRARRAPGSLPKSQSGEIEVDREIRARQEIVEQDRRAYPEVGSHRHSTEADGSGPEPGPDWPHHW